MKLDNLFSVAILATLLMPAFLLSAADRRDAPNPKRLCVVPFKTGSHDQEYGERLANVLVTELIRNKSYELIERTKLESILKEQGMSLTGLVEQLNSPQPGFVKGIDYMVFGTITEASATDTTINLIPIKVKVAVTVNLIDVRTAQIILSEVGESSKTFNWSNPLQRVSPDNFTEVFRLAIAKVAFEIMEYFAPMQAPVVLVKDKEVTIRLGREDGVKVGQQFSIVREGDVIRDPNTGEILGVDQLDIAEITISRIDANLSVAKVVKIFDDKSGGKKRKHEIKIGDLAKPKKAKDTKFPWSK
jgi:hypothetical protein